jgi:protein-S-isoprenylcysteine O-methyltransferase Ste14
MIFLNEHSPSIPAKVFMSMGVLAGTLTATALTTGYPDWFMNVLNFEKVEGNIYRQIVMFLCCLIYFIRFTIGLFVFIQRKISWFEGGLVTVLFFMMFYFFGISAGSHPDSIGIIDIFGISLFLFGSCINTLADYQRFSWKRKTENKGRLYTSGLFKYSMHINYFGDAAAYFGLALITYNIVCLCISMGMVLYFIAFEIPRLDEHLSKKYKHEFTEYSKTTKKFVPFIY